MKLAIVTILLSCLWTSQSFAIDLDLTRDQQVNILDEAQASYDKAASLLRSDPESADAMFRESSDRFQLLIDSGIINGDLYYDLGNACLQSGDLGRAVVNYLRADALNPTDPRIEANLSHARSLVRPQVTKDGSDALLHRLTFWHHGWPVKWRLVLFASAWTILWASILIRIWRRYPGFLWFTGIAAVVTIAFGASTFISIASSDASQQGVLIRDDVVVRKGNAESYSPQFEQPVNQGLEFRVLEQRPDWLHIELNNGESGWIPRSDAEIVSEEMTANMAII